MPPDSLTRPSTPTRRPTPSRPGPQRSRLRLRAGAAFRDTQRALVGRSLRRMVAASQTELLERLRRDGRVIVRPRPPQAGLGDPSNYYHWLFDVLLPLEVLTEHAPPGSRIDVIGGGPFTERWPDVLPDAVRPLDGPPQGPALDLVGMNPHRVPLPHGRLPWFRDRLMARLGVEPAPFQHTVVLVERAPTEAGVEGGARRRSILNHDELRAALEEHVAAPYALRNVVLAELPLAEQVRRFSEAALVIGQHGAGLANCLWMAPGSPLVEISSAGRRSHYRTLSSSCGLRRFLFPVATNHPTIEPDALLGWMARHRELRPFLAV